MCRACSDVSHCGRECQLAAWPGHKAACKARAKELEERTQVTKRESREP